MPSTPLIDSSSGVATVSASTFGLAPGYCARTTTDGGTTSGYSEIGSTRMARRPARKIRIDSTPAKIGRSMKNFERFTAPSSRRADAGSALCEVRRAAVVGFARRRVHRHRLRLDERARAHPLQAVDDDALAVGHALGDDPKATHGRADRHRPIDDAIVAIDNEHEALVLIRAQCTLVHNDRWLRLGLTHLQPGELSGHQSAVGIREDGPDAHGSAAGIDLVVDELQLALVRDICPARRHAHGNTLDLTVGGR